MSKPIEYSTIEIGFLNTENHTLMISLDNADVEEYAYIRLNANTGKFVLEALQRRLQEVLDEIES